MKQNGIIKNIVVYGIVFLVFLIGIIPLLTGTILIGIADSMKEKRKKKKIKKMLRNKVEEKNQTFLFETIGEMIDEYFSFDEEEDIQLDREMQDLLHRLSKIKKNIKEGVLTSIDIDLILFLMGEKPIEEVSYKVKGVLEFQLDEPYLSILKQEIQGNYYLKHYIHIKNDTLMEVKDWRRDKEELFDIFFFIHTYGKIMHSTISFPEEEYGFTTIRIKNGKIVNCLQEEEAIEIKRNGYFSTLSIDLKEKRKILMSESIYVPLMEAYMAQKTKWKHGSFTSFGEELLLPNGEWDKVCNHCQFRIRQITHGGCTVCRPKKIVNEPKHG